MVKHNLWSIIAAICQLSSSRTENSDTFELNFLLEDIFTEEFMQCSRGEKM